MGGRSEYFEARVPAGVAPAADADSESAAPAAGTRALTLHALHHGDPAAPALVLLHGGGANAHWWDHVAPALAERFHVVALDFRGHGDSEHPEELRRGAFSEDLEALLTHLGAPDAILVGHSMGGHVAIEHAARGAATRALVVIDISWGGRAAAGRLARRALRLPLRTYETREEAVERYDFVPRALGVPDALRRQIAEQSVQARPDGRFAYKFDPRWFGVPSRPRPDPAGVGCPTLLLRGSESSILSREHASALARSLPDGRLVEVARAGHHVHLDQPEAAIRALTSFLDDTAPAA